MYLYPRSSSKQDLAITNGKFVISPEELTLTLKTDDNQPITHKLISKRILAKLNDSKLLLQLDVLHTKPSNNSKGTLVFIHGNSCSKKVFTKQINHFKNDYEIIALDLLGHGDSTKLENEELAAEFYNPFAMIAIIKQLLEKLHVSSAHLIGWSLGGNLAYGVANANPELVASITSIGSTPAKFSQQGLITGYGEWFAELVSFWIERPTKFDEKSAAELSASLGFPESEKYVIEDLIKSDPLMRKYLVKDITELDSPEFLGSCIDAEAFITATNIPVNLLLGELDKSINFDNFNKVTANLKSPSRAEIIPNAPHAAFTVTHFDFNENIERFIQDIANKPRLKK